MLWRICNAPLERLGFFELSGLARPSAIAIGSALSFSSFFCRCAGSLLRFDLYFPPFVVETHLFLAFAGTFPNASGTGLLRWNVAPSPHVAFIGLMEQATVQLGN